MKKEDYMKFSKDKLAEILAQRDLEDEEVASDAYCGWAPLIQI